MLSDVWGNKVNSDFEQYLIAATRFGITHKERDFRAGNRYADKLQSLGARMRIVAEGQGKLIELLLSDDPYVNLWAAKDCLFFAPERAFPVLERIAQLGGLISLSATTTLDEWRKGRLT